MKHIQYLFISTIFIVVLFACIAIPTDEPPGVGERAEKGYAASEPVIAALEMYHAEHGSYPEKLADLVPAYLPAIPTKTDELDFSYFSTGDNYSFSFHYLGPGMNTCKYTPEDKWKCSGAY